MMKPSYFLLGLAILLVFGTQPQAYGDLPGKVSGFLEAHCVGCHSKGNSEGGLDLSTLGFDLADQATFAKWQHVYQRIHDKEMPPSSEGQPSQNEIDELLIALG
jgi:hypothetical protein